MNQISKRVRGGEKRNRLRVTIKDVAEELSMSKSTVSRALNGYSDIAEQTRLRVETTARKLGYRPMAQAQAIRTGLVKSLGLVLNVGGHGSHLPFLTNFIDGISRRASRENWTLTVATGEDSDDVLRITERLTNEHKVDGFILPRTRIEDRRIAYLRGAHMPFILYGRTGDDTDCGWYDIKGELAMELAVLRLARFGHKRIGFINALDFYNYAPLRLQGFLSGMEKAGLAVDESLIASGAVDKDSGEAAGERLLGAAIPPTAIVCAVDLAALGLYRAARKQGLTIGKDLSIISYDGIAEGEYSTPPLTSFSVNNRQVGEMLADLLIKRIGGDAPETLRQLGEATLIERASDGPPILNFE